MVKYIQLIQFEEARKIAEESALQKLEQFRKNPAIPILSKHFEEADCCWIFFRNKEIFGPEERKISWDFAIAVSKKGEVSLIADYRNEPDQLRMYLQKISNYFLEKGI
jgi:hypothetical protein